ncbi:MtrB/PioB family decaheme-associated outer membrane protein [Ferrimonas senticii]|uniref:MtrB/PioB family decaheme-associated outer membrane protein n=1 Tax=Ferrimonas senticii TaxID=394566 RepID=UPI00041B8D70|nr:MtrB/PioB family decaheme-associated outer membrane protein [Ferrimonas senticii]
MKIHLNLITLALLGFSATASANYGLANANTSKINLEKWQCKRCDINEGLTGQVAASLGVVEAAADHAANHFNGFDDGAAYGLDADLDYQRAGHQASFDAYNLGSEHGVATISAGKSDAAMVQLDYAQYRHVNAQAFSPYAYVGGELIDLGHGQNQDLELTRERFGAALQASVGEVETYADFQRENKTGTRSASIAGMTPTNVLAPVNQHTDRYRAGASLSGSNWFTGVSYLYSDFSNDLGTAIDFNGYQNALTNAPSNDAYQLMLNGSYQFGVSNIAGRIVSGQMNQRADLVANPSVTAFDGEVKTLDINLDYSTLVNNQLRLRAGFDYSDRDNRSTIVSGPNLVADPLTGELEDYALIDTTSTRANVGSSYRIASGYRLNADYQFEQKQRHAHGWDKEETQDHSADIKLKITQFERWDIALKGGYSHRDMSKIDADRLLSGEDNALLRRYNLADRDRIVAEFNVIHTPMANVAVDLKGHWAKDDYSDTEIGLTEGQDYGYDLGLSYHKQQLKLQAFGGMQWINTDQAGSSNGGNANWTAEVEDQFLYLGAGADYQWRPDTAIGVDYLYSDSASDTVVQQGIQTPYDDYFAISHSITVYGDHQLNPKMGLRLEYRYERFEETDYANVGTGSPYLGNLDHNYNAHQLMLTISYQL